MGQEACCYGEETVTKRLSAVQRDGRKEAAERCCQEGPGEGCIEDVWIQNIRHLGRMSRHRMIHTSLTSIMPTMIYACTTPCPRYIANHLPRCKICDSQLVDFSWA